jgi:GxxExxY protein
MEQIEKLVNEVSIELGHGRREKIYQNALTYSLNYSGITASTELPHPVYFKGHCVGTTFIDIVTDTCLIEIKYVKSLNESHRSQVAAYSRDLALDAILINFGSTPVEIEYIKYNKPTLHQ